MSEIIKVLPDSIANQIAAGEVIERPASLVKELVENSVDAGATRISISFHEAGKSLLKVSDNGMGMSAIDARMAFERHATSKISKIDDLYDLHSMGFRGEALASIASVAQIELTTRREDMHRGNKLFVSSSKVTDIEPVACEVGSTFVVRNLFFNVPVRRKFLASERTEQERILSAFRNIALVNPKIEFSITANDKLLHHLPSSSLKDRITHLFGKKIDKSLIPIHWESPMVNISGFITYPSAAKQRGYLQYFFVNGRYMKHFSFAKAITNVYQDLIPTGHNPSYFIYLDVPRDRIDVNVHPTKTDIKFVDDEGIFKVLMVVVREAISSLNAIPSLDFDSEKVIEIPRYEGRKQAMPNPPSIAIDPSYNPFRQISDPFIKQKALPSDNSWDALYNDFEKGKPLAPLSQTETQFTSSPQDAPLFEPEQESDILPTRSSDSFLFLGKYIVTPLKNDLALIDIHRASFRIKYDTYVTSLSSSQVMMQNLIFPQKINLANYEEKIVTPIVDEINKMGFDLTFLGAGVYLLNSIPSIVNSDGISDLITESIALLLTQSTQHESIRDIIVQEFSLRLAEHVALSYGALLTPIELNTLRIALLSSSDSLYDPKGRPIIFKLHEEDIRKNFFE